jgi:hypothetical protein
MQRKFCPGKQRDERKRLKHLFLLSFFSHGRRVRLASSRQSFCRIRAKNKKNMNRSRTAVSNRLFRSDHY